MTRLLKRVRLSVSGSEVTASTSHTSQTQNHTPPQNSNKYRAYASAVDKALKAFESTTEWADLIAALGKLSKVFSSNSKVFNDIPSSVTVAKRLSQCLHPALPSGVHLKALETYRQVFTILGRTDNLARQLYLYAVGLFPLMDHCGIKVKSELMAIFEQYLLPLGAHLRPALPGFIAAVLFALEEGTEFYDRSFVLLEMLMDKVGNEAFYACLWQAVLGSPAVRLPALIFVNAKYEKRKNIGEQFLLMCGGDHADHMIAALCAVAEDSGPILVQRHLLDFLCAVFSLNSDHVAQQDFVHLLRRCLFVVLRRDMSLNRRLYQWLLNRSNDSAVTGLPVSGVEEKADIDFFSTYSLPLIKLAIMEYLKLDTVEVPTTTHIGVVGGSWDNNKDTQTQFTEVRVCRLLQYFMDRSELGTLILQETLAMFLEFSCIQDLKMIEELQDKCEELDPSFIPIWSSKLDSTSTQRLSQTEQTRRLDEIRKTFNSLLNLLDTGFLWDYLGNFFASLLESKLENEKEEEDNLTIEERQTRDFAVEKKRDHIVLFPLMVSFCIRTVQLDSHGDIRGKHLALLLNKIARKITEVGCDGFSRDNLVALVAVLRRLLFEVNQSVMAVENQVKSPSSREGSFMEINESAASISERDRSQSQIIEDLKQDRVEKQKLIETCLHSTFDLLVQTCDWYVKDRERDKAGVLSAVSVLLKDFADFPIYCFKPEEYQWGKTNKCAEFPIWLNSLMSVVEFGNCKNTGYTVPDFEARARIIDFIINLYVRSNSVLEQHRAFIGQSQIFSQTSFFDLSNKSYSQLKTTTTVLLKPFLTEQDLEKLESDRFFTNVAEVLWDYLNDMDDHPSCHQSSAQLLHKLHSRKATDPGSDCEEIILADLTSEDKVISGLAAKKFRKLWTLTRSNLKDDITTGIVYKPFNRVIMVFLGVLSDEALGSDKIELRAIAGAWLHDCAKHNDLPRILQMLATILLNPATARVSLQFLHIQSRITSETMPVLPKGVNAISLATANLKQNFHHVCKESGRNCDSRKARSPETTPREFEFIDCTQENNPWLHELRKRLLLPPTPETIRKKTEEVQQIINGGGPGKILGHRRTISDIPQFDIEEDVESVEGSMDEIEHEVFDVLQCIVDAVCEEEEGPLNTTMLVDESVEELDGVETDEEGKEIQTITLEEQTEEPSSQETDLNTYSYISGRSAEKNSGAEEGLLETIVEEKGIEQPRHYNVVAAPFRSFSNTSTAGNLSAGRLPEIKRIKLGHRRQDSLQESIFSTTTQDLKLFDPAELPKVACDENGDDKQPLFDEAHAHMLLYAENPRTVDLGRTEEIFKILSALLRSQRGAGLGRMVVNCMVFNNTTNLPQSPNGTACQLIDYLIRHYKAIQGEGFWYYEKSNGSGEAAKNKHCTFLELFITVTLYFLRTYYLNSPTTLVSEADLHQAWKCKIAALEFFTDLLRELQTLVKDIQSKDFVQFILTIYWNTKIQRCLISFLLTAVPAINQTLAVGMKQPVSSDIAEFNNGRPNSELFKDLIFSYQRTLLDMASAVVSLEYHMYQGLQTYTEQSLSIYSEKPFVVNRQIYNSPQIRSTINNPRVLMVELRLFLAVTLQALQRHPERHQLWFHFITSVLPFLDRTLPTFCIHVVDQLCYNLQECVQSAYPSILSSEINPLSPDDSVYSSAYHMQLQKRPSILAQTGIGATYPSNYALSVLESLTTIMHYCILDSFASNTLIFGSSVVQNANQQAIRNPSVEGQLTMNSSSGVSSMAGSAISIIPGAKATGELINNFFGKVFTSSDSGTSSVPLAKYDPKSSLDIWRQAREELLKNLSTALSTICDVWAIISTQAEARLSQPKLPIGTPDQLKQLILDLLSPIAKRHPGSLVHAFSWVWLTKAKKSSEVVARNEQDQPSFVYSKQQLNIAHLILNIKAMPLQGVIMTISDSLKESNAAKQAKPGSPEKQNFFPTEVSLLELLHGCVKKIAPAELRECWSALNILFTESPLGNLMPRAVFLEFIIFADFIRICSTGQLNLMEERQSNRSLQEVCQKLTEAINNIVAWQLESTTWLKRTLVVRQDTGSTQKISDISPTMDVRPLSGSLASSEVNSIKGSTNSLITQNTRLSSFDAAGSSGQLPLLPLDKKSSASNMRSSLKDTNNNKKDPTNSTQALFLLAENLAELIDSICRSEDKEKLLPTLQIVWVNTLPYLRAKSARNARFFLASSQFLASISTFNYMRPVWKKTTLELLLDPGFFKMDMQSLRQWLVVIDNLMSNDKTSFKELLAFTVENMFFLLNAVRRASEGSQAVTSFSQILARIPTAPNTSLSSLITSKEQEYEMRAQALKRLAFVVLSSQMDQYSTQLPDIQERLSDSLRLAQVPVVHVQVFNCYRVLLIRMKPFNFVSMWPSMVTELIQVLIQIEQQLTGGSSSSLADDLKGSRDEQWMQLYLSACKLLETLCTLPSGYMTQFQMCHWAFISSLASNSEKDAFIPFTTRMSTLLTNKYGKLSSSDEKIVSASLLGVKTLMNFGELRPFFHALANQHKLVAAGITGAGQENQLRDAGSMNGSLTLKEAIKKIEHSLYVDFAEHLQF